MTVREDQQAPEVQRGLYIQESPFSLEVRRNRLAQQVLPVQGRQGIRERRVCLVDQLGLMDRSALLVLVRQGIQERRVYLVGQRDLGRRCSQEFQPGRDNHLCQVYPEVLGHPCIL